MKETSFVYQKENGHCFYCGIKTKIPKTGKQCNITATKDHLIPKKLNKRTGKTGNLVLACHACNNKKGPHTSFEFLGLKYMRYMFAEAARKTLYVPEYTKEIPFD